MFASESSLTHSDSFTVEICSRSPLLALRASAVVLTAVKEDEREEGEGEITFITGRSNYTCIIHGMEMNSHCIYRLLITSQMMNMHTGFRVIQTGYLTR